jgi:hypothetical protein
MVWSRLTGTPWHIIAGIERRSERTCQRYYNDALDQIADELNTLERDR